ncbi:MAG TPA: cytochrome b [Burkholderiales bacterium]|nr:cytochrome b [Burkholderiales bacterium]
MPGYGKVAATLHWVVGVAIVFQCALGWWMLDLPKGADGTRAWWFNFHKSVGLAIAALVFFRIAWRLQNRPPGLPAWLPAWQRTAALLSHRGLYACMVALPVSGYLGSTFSGYPVKLFGATLPAWGWKWPEAKALLSTVHETAAWLLAALLCVHIGAALTHAIRRDGVLARIWI